MNRLTVKDLKEELEYFDETIPLIFRVSGKDVSLNDVGIYGQEGKTVIDLFDQTSDDPSLDGTGFECEAFHRGVDYAFYDLVARINFILEGKDDGLGSNNEPWRSLRRRLLGLVNPIKQKETE